MAIVASVHLLAAILFLANLAAPSRSLERASHFVITLALILNISHILFRLAKSGYTAVTAPGGAEIAALVLVAVYLIVSVLYSESPLTDFGDFVGRPSGLYFAFATGAGAAVAPLVFPAAATLSVGAWLAPVPAPLVPLTARALGSIPSWITSAAGALLALASWYGIVYLLFERLHTSGKRGLPGTPLLSLLLIDILSYRLLFIGFPILTVGLLLSLPLRVWTAEFQPIHAALFVIWLVYATHFCGRFFAGWSGRRCALLSILGFGLLVGTLLGQVAYQHAGLDRGTAP